MRDGLSSLYRLGFERPLQVLDSDLEAMSIYHDRLDRDSQLGTSQRGSV